MGSIRAAWRMNIVGTGRSVFADSTRVSPHNELDIHPIYRAALPRVGIGTRARGKRMAVRADGRTARGVAVVVPNALRRGNATRADVYAVRAAGGRARYRANGAPPRIVATTQACVYLQVNTNNLRRA